MGQDVAVGPLWWVGVRANTASANCQTAISPDGIWRTVQKRLFMSRVEDPASRLDCDNHGWISALNATAIVAFWDNLIPGALME